MADVGHLTFPEYAAIDAVNWSTLKEMAQSPAHYRHRLSVPREDTPRLAFGRAVHTAVLEPDRFPLECVVYDGGRRAGKEWAEFEAVNGDRTILRADEYATCIAVRDAVHAHGPAARLLQGESEVTCQWTDPDTGLPCKGRLDHMFDGCIIDLKTTGSVDTHTFTTLSARMLYHSQMAFYDRAADGYENPRIIAVEIEPPYDVGVFRLTDDAMLAGSQQVSDLLAHVALCRERDEWPGRYCGEQDLTIPPWMAVDPDADLGITLGGEAT